MWPFLEATLAKHGELKVAEIETGAVPEAYERYLVSPRPNR